MAIKKTITLILSDVIDNSNKVWIGELHEDETVITRWGRVGYPMQSKTFSGVGESFLIKKEKEKVKKGYVYPKTINGVSGTKSVSSDSLDKIAKKQLSKNNPELDMLVDRLIQSNIHNITSNTNITFNSSSGLFQTPLGIITQEGINEARNLLVELKRNINNVQNDIRAQLLSKYLTIIPQNVGMKIVPHLLFNTEADIQKQSDILDSLESSYKSTLSNNTTEIDNQNQEEKVFEVELAICEDGKEIDRLIKIYESTKKQMHGYGHVKVRKIYSVKVAEMNNNFNKNIGEIVEVYHGTSQSNLLSILKSGIKTSPPSTAYIAGKMFGNGIYGAINSSKSLGYTFGRWGGNSGDSGWLFVCDFAMGKIFKPSMSFAGPKEGYDSVWAEAARCRLAHDELIVYKNNQVNIKYLLECK